MVEAIAEKEISKDPLEFIKRENFQVNDEDHFSSDNEEMVFPRPRQSEHHESRDETENEYHSHEKAVAFHIVKYKDTRESAHDVALSSPRGISGSPEGILSREKKLINRAVRQDDEEEKLPIPEDLHDQLLGEEMQSKNQTNSLSNRTSAPVGHE